MSRISSGKYAVFLAFLIVVLGAVAFAKGGLYLTIHEGDAIHMFEILLRMLKGQMPHLDFSTPIGIFAFLPVLLFAKTGLGLGQAFIAAQIFVAVLLAPAIWRVGISRLSGLTAWAFGAVSIAMITALVHGENVTALSVSMYYNRWAWICTFVVILISVLPADEADEAPVLDGVIAGVMLAVMALIKPTYFVSFVLPVAIGFITRGAIRSLVVGVITGVGIAAAMVAFFGLEFFPSYIADLVSVTQSASRSAPGATFLEVLNGPRFLIGTVTLILSVIVLRQAGQARAGLLLLLLAPGFVYTTYQNFGNDPKWLIVLAFFLLAHRPVYGQRVLFNADARNAVAALALAAFALIAPSLQNIITSPFRHLSQDAEEFVLQFPENPALTDVYMRPMRRSVVLGRYVMVDEHPEIAPYVTEEEIVEPIVFLGETLPRCLLQGGDIVLYDYMADRLKQAPFNYGPDSQFFVADIGNSIWMQGGFEPLLGGAPWYYSGVPGIENADALIVPTCSINDVITRNALAAVEMAGLTLKPPLKDSMMWVYPIVK